MKPIEVWGNEDGLLHHLFQNVQTKWMGLAPTPATSTETKVAGNGIPLLPMQAYAGSIGELRRLAAILGKHLDGAAQRTIHLDIIYCDYIHLQDYSIAQCGEAKVDEEAKKLRYEFAKALTHFKADQLSFRLYTAIEAFANDPDAYAKLFSVPQVLQRGRLLRGMADGVAEINYADAKSAESAEGTEGALVWWSGHPMSKIGFDYSCFYDKPLTKDSTVSHQGDSNDAVCFIQSPAPGSFVTCVLLA
jgi:hypothetical protein